MPTGIPNKKNPDEVIKNQDLPAQEMPSAEVENQRLREENSGLREQIDTAFDRLNRLESIANKGTMRKYDELNDPDSLKKVGKLPSFDGKDPFVKMVKTGNSWIDEKNQIHDDQTIQVKTHSGAVDKAFTLPELFAKCSGNSIFCQVNNWEEYILGCEALAKKRHEFQRMTGKTAKSNTVETLALFKKMESELTLNVTLSLDYGKTYTGETLDVPEVVFNAIS